MPKDPIEMTKDLTEVRSPQRPLTPDKSLTDLDNLPEPDDHAEKIIENLEAGLISFKEVLVGLNK